MLRRRSYGQNRVPEHSLNRPVAFKFTCARQRSVLLLLLLGMSESHVSELQ